MHARTWIEKIKAGVLEQIEKNEQNYRQKKKGGGGESTLPHTSLSAHSTTSITDSLGTTPFCTETLNSRSRVGGLIEDWDAAATNLRMCMHVCESKRGRERDKSGGEEVGELELAVK